MTSRKVCRFGWKNAEAQLMEDNVMDKKINKYDIKKLPFPIRPGDTVFFVLDNNAIEEDKVTAVGINEDCKLMVRCGNDEYEIGNLDRVFLSRDDAERYLEEPDDIPDDYGEIEYKDLDLPYYPGTDFYYCDCDGFTRRWEIYEEYYTYVWFDIDGEVSVGDGESECTMIGKDVDPCFDTLRKARAYVRSQV